jgi:hypothetical protein
LIFVYLQIERTTGPQKIRFALELIIAPNKEDHRGQKRLALDLSISLNAANYRTEQELNSLGDQVQFGVK